MLSDFFSVIEIVRTAAKDAHYSSYLLAIVAMLILPTQSVLCSYQTVMFYCPVLRRCSPLARSPRIKAPGSYTAQILHVQTGGERK